MADIIDWPGKSGTKHRYFFLANPTSAGIMAVGGNYAFVKRLQDGTFRPVYFGQADDLKARIPNHDRLAEATQAGMTHVMAHTQSDLQTRLAEEADLIGHWNPPLNTQGRTVSTKVSGRSGF